MSGARCIALIFLAAYPIAMHATLVLVGSTPTGTFLLLAEFCVATSLSLACFRNRWPLVLVTVVAGGTSLLFRTSAAIVVAATGVPHALANAGLLAVFGWSLLPARKALITSLSELLNGGNIAPELVRYTRNVTSAWCIFFAVQLLASLNLLLFAPVAVWSFFVNVLTFPLVAAMFISEYAYRRFRFRNHRPRGVFQIIDAFNAHGIREMYSASRPESR